MNSMAHDGPLHQDWETEEDLKPMAYDVELEQDLAH
jgi:hypothetical protein